MTKCLICKKGITDDELQYEDYYSVFRGHNAITYGGKHEAMRGLICFNCIHTEVTA